MKTKKLLTALLALVMAASMLSCLALTSLAALNDPNNVKDIALTLNPPKAGDTVNLSYDGVTCASPMEYKVVSVDWYKNNATDFLNDRLGRDGNENYFIGGNSYTVKVTLQVKGDRDWNLDFKQGEVDYSHITATINGKPATLEPHQVHREDTKMLCVCYTFENISAGNIIPAVNIAAPVAGQQQAEVKTSVGNERSMRIAPSEYNWYVHAGGKWVYMQPNEVFVAGKDYRVEFALEAKDGFRYRIEGAQTVGADKYIYGYINGKQTSMKVVTEQKVTYGYDFLSCAANELNEVSFSGIQAPVAGQHPQYTVTMGDTTYSLETDDAVSGGAQYGFVNGIAWTEKAGTPLTAQSVFEQGKSYNLSFFIRTDAIHSFADWVQGSANVGYVSVQTLAEDPTLALINVEFSPCGGGVMTEINIGGVSAPVTGAYPDYDFTYGQGYGKADQDPAIVWYDLTGDKLMGAGDVFEYGHQYELIVVLCTDKVLNGNAGEFEFAPFGQVKAKINGADAHVLQSDAQLPENLWMQVAMAFECGVATVEEVGVEVDEPAWGKNPAQQIKLEKENCYKIDGFMFTDAETDTVLKADDVYVGGRNYYFLCSLQPAKGYRFNSDITKVTVNNQEANVIACTENAILLSFSFVAIDLPLCSISFSDGNGGAAANSFVVKSGSMITLPECEAIAVPQGKDFAGWTLDGGMSLLGGNYYVVEGTENIEFVAWFVDNGEHTQHVYGENYVDNGQGQHERECLVEGCVQKDSGNHDYGNCGACDVICTVCGHERVSESEGYKLHNFEFACSEVCPTCGKQRATVHTPGEAATCTNPQQCTVCGKILADVLAHTPGASANCGHAQNCTVCGVELAPITGEHVPGAAATCTDAQKCSVCGKELASAKGHVAGVEWMQDKDGHWHVCATCNGECDRAEHADADGDKHCDVCGDKIGGISAGAVVAIVIAAVLVAGVGGFCVFRFVIKKKRLTELRASSKKK